MRADETRERALAHLRQLQAKTNPTAADDVARRRIAAALGIDATRAQAADEKRLKDLAGKLGLTYQPKD